MDTLTNAGSTEMTYDRSTGTVIYRSKVHLGLKRNFQVMPAAQYVTAPRAAQSTRATQEGLSFDRSGVATSNCS